MTDIYGVIGDPIKHSLSAPMQNRAFREAGLDAIYLPFHVHPSDLHSFVAAARRWPCRGFNVTLPHKQNIMSYLDDVTKEAQTIGAVNTVLQREGQLIGYNTDAIGYLHSLSEEKKWEPHGKSVTLLGAGGGARAVAHSLLKAGASQIYVVDQITTKANELAENINKLFVKSQRMDVIEWADLTECLTKSDLLVNATPVGLCGTSFDSLPLEALPDNALVSDLVYTPRVTPLLHEAKKHGYQTHGGLGMLLYQGAESFRIWTEKEPNVAVMRKALEEALGE